MTNWLIHTFIKDYENIQDEQVRYSYGILTTIMGLVCNTFLCLLKVISGMMIHSVSIMSDGFNNLSDGLSCLITLIGFKICRWGTSIWSWQNGIHCFIHLLYYHLCGHLWLIERKHHKTDSSRKNHIQQCTVCFIACFCSCESMDVFL